MKVVGTTWNYVMVSKEMDLILDSVGTLTGNLRNIIVRFLYSTRKENLFYYDNLGSINPS